jgi:hypothetical protein
LGVVFQKIFERNRILDQTKISAMKYVKMLFVLAILSFAISGKIIASGNPGIVSVDQFSNTLKVIPTDNEPNNNSSEANEIGLNSSISGTINNTDDYYDFYKFTINHDGKVVFTIVPNASLDAYLDLFDQDGSGFLTFSMQTGLGVSDTLIYRNLKAGTYYIRVGGGGNGSYTLNNVFIPTSIPDGNDAEPNDLPAESVPIDYNISYTGHLGFFGNGTSDYYDYYSFTIPFDGKMTFILVPENTLDGYIDLYDQDGVSFLMYSMQTGVGVNDTLIYGNLKAGTYFFRIGGGGFGSYTLNNVFTATSIPKGNDIEPNDTQSESFPIGLDGSNTGHLGFLGNQKTDYYDYYSFTTSVDGKILFTLVQDNTLDAYIDLYDQDGVRFLRYSIQTGLGVTDSLSFSYLKAGTYYIMIGGGGYGSYTLNNFFTPTAIPNGNDAEPNDIYSEANPIIINSSKTGHLNYFGNGLSDNSDFYSFSIPAKGKITATLVPENTLDGYIELYDHDGISFLMYTIQTGDGMADTLIYENLNAGNYYMRIGGSGYGSYTLNLSFTEGGLSVESSVTDQMKIIPDRKNGILTINNVPVSEISSCEIVDMSGKIILKERLFNINNQIAVTEKGMYLIKVSTGKEILVRKVVF